MHQKTLGYFLCLYKTKYDSSDNKKISNILDFRAAKRWENAENGKPSESVIPFLQNAHNYVDETIKIEDWERFIMKTIFH